MVDVRDGKAIIVGAKHVGVPGSVVFADGRKAVVIESMTDKTGADLACYVIDVSDVPYAAIADDEPTIGAQVQQAGYPNEHVWTGAQAKWRSGFLRTRTELSINVATGDSGSGVFNMSGELIGVVVTNSRPSTHDPREYPGQCVPHGRVKRFVEACCFKIHGGQQHAKPKPPQRNPLPIPTPGIDLTVVNAKLSAIEARQNESDRKTDGVVKDLADVKAALLRMTDLIGKIQDKPGIVGKTGPAGPEGPPGIDGKAGRDGKDGKPGSNGIDGKDGKPGLNGIDGKDGRPGKDADPTLVLELQKRIAALEADAARLYRADLLDANNNVIQSTEFGRNVPLRLRLIPVTPKQ